MGPTVAEKGILKLVHPGRYVQILREPITAGEVMSKNPRHCITRPDVFKLPWIVINPASVLPLGKVFFLVPNHTVYDLMKSEKHRDHRIIPSLPLPPLPKTTSSLYSPSSSSSSPCKAFAGMTPKHQIQINRRLTTPRNIDDDDGDGAGFKRCEEIALRKSEIDHHSGEEEFSSPWLGMRNSYWEVRRQLLSETTSTPLIEPNGGDRTGGPSCSISCRRKEESAPTLKSCLRKPDSARKALNLKVSFFLQSRSDTERVRERSTSAGRQVRISDFVNW